MRLAGLILLTVLGTAFLVFYFAKPAATAEEKRSSRYETIDLAYNEQRALQNWMLNCQGCHKPDGSGLSDQGMPDLRGNVSVFLKAEGGRDYLMRVPGVTNNSIEDAELAELLNWVLYTYDPDGLPAGFKPYTAQEVAIAREKPLGTEAHAIRQDLLQRAANED